MIAHSPEIDQLIQLLARLPGLGPRSARRAALAMIKKRETVMTPLARSIETVARTVHACTICGNLDTVDPCAICTDPKRDQGLICVVEEVADLWALDRGGDYRGTYHVLGGVLSALDGVTPEDLTIGGLVERVATGQIREVILATNATVDGQTTAHYITDRLGSSGVAVTALAHGVPVGGELDYLDDGTLAAAMAARKPL